MQQGTIDHGVFGLLLKMSLAWVGDGQRQGKVMG